MHKQFRPISKENYLDPKRSEKSPPKFSIELKGECFITFSSHLAKLLAKVFSPKSPSQHPPSHTAGEVKINENTEKARGADKQ